MQSTLDLGPDVSIYDVGSSGERLVALGGQETPEAFHLAVWVSEDDGSTWDQVDMGELTDGMGEVWAVHAVGETFWVPGLRDPDGPSTADQCYVDIEVCREPAEPVPVVLISADGRTWGVVDASIVGAGVQLQETEVTTTSDGRLLLLSSGGDGLTVWSWPETPVFPLLEDGPATTLPPIAEPLAGDVLEPGVRYRLPLHTHCGIEWIGRFNSTAWKLVEGQDWEAGAGEVPPEGWPAAGQMLYGYVTLVAADRIEYTTAAGGLIAAYAPTTERIPGCS
jgi:hypothetical protein